MISIHPNLNIAFEAVGEKLEALKLYWSYTNQEEFGISLSQILIGQETGGYAYGVTGYLRLGILLPNTQARIRIPLVITRHNVSLYTVGRGVMPTHEISNQDRIRSIKDHSDPEIEMALELLGKVKLSIMM